MFDGAELSLTMPAITQETFAGAPPTTSGVSAIDAVRREVTRVQALSPVPRPERLAGLHNPWSNTAIAADRWAFLDLCHSQTIVEGVKELIGPDVVLWDSQLYLKSADYQMFAASGREGRYWPVYPLSGAISLVSFANPRIVHRRISAADIEPLSLSRPDEPVYVIRYYPATSKFVRDPRFPANWIAMEEQVLLNYTTRALWLVSGEDRAGNDFVTGFSEQVPTWKLRN